MTGTPTYMQQVFAVALMYQDHSFTYNAVESACRDIARDYKRQTNTVMEDFEIACDELQNG
jgi:hypothetical protein